MLTKRMNDLTWQVISPSEYELIPPSPDIEISVKRYSDGWRVYVIEHLMRNGKEEWKVQVFPDYPSLYPSLYEAVDGLEIFYEGEPVWRN